MHTHTHKRKKNHSRSHNLSFEDFLNFCETMTWVKDGYWPEEFGASAASSQSAGSSQQDPQQQQQASSSKHRNNLTPAPADGDSDQKEPSASTTSQDDHHRNDSSSSPHASSYSSPTDFAASSPSSLLNLRNFLEPSCHYLLGVVSRQIVARFLSSSSSLSSSVSPATNGGGDNDDDVADSSTSNDISAQYSCAKFASSTCAVVDTTLDIVVFPLRGLPERGRRWLFFSHVGELQDESGQGMSVKLPGATDEEVNCFIASCVAVAFLILALLVRLSFRRYVTRLMAKPREVR